MRKKEPQKNSKSRQLQKLLNQKFTYFSIFTILLFILLSSPVYSQVYTENTCGMTGGDITSPLKSNCEMDGDIIINNHRDEIIPSSGPPIVLPVNFVIVQDLNGNNNFDLNNSDHLNFLNGIVNKMNGRMDNLVPEPCDCTQQPTFHNNSFIQYDVNIMAMRTAIWDHNVNDIDHIFSGNGNDTRCPIGDHYVGQLNNELLSHPDYSEAINFFFTHGAAGTSQYQGSWYSGFRCENDPNHPALIHAPNGYENYLFISGGNGTQTLDMLSNFNARSAAHEIFHQFQIGVGHKHTCQFNLMNGRRIPAPAPDPDDPSTALTGCQLRQAFGTMMAYHMSKYMPCIQSFDRDIEITTNEIWDTSTKILSNVRIKPGASLTINCNIEMQQDGIIYVEEGGRLLVDGGTITSCGTWHGIQVEGNMLGYSVEITNSSVIENANKGVSMFHEQGWLLGSGNANVLIDNTIFNNCKRMFAMGAWPRQKNASRITNSIQNGGKWGVTNWNCQKVTAEGNIFNGQLRDCIHTIDGSFKSISDNKFYSQDIDVLLINTSIFNSSTIEDNEFNGTNTGLHIVGGSVGFMDIKENEFDNRIFGAFFDNHATYNIEKNEFKSDFGAVSASNGNDGNEVLRNEFDNNVVGIYPFEDNSGYNFTFNCFETGLVDANIDDEIFRDIKSIDGSAGNCFTHNGTFGALDIDGSMSTFTYYHHDDKAIDCHDVLSTNTGFDLDVDVPRDSDCANGTGGPNGFNPCATHETEQDRILAEQILLNRIALVWQNPYLTLVQKRRITEIYQRCLRRIKKKRAEVEMEQGDFNDAKSLYVGLDTLIEEKLTLYGIILSSEDYVEARSYLNTIPETEDGDLIDFKIVQNINIDRFEDSQYQASEAIISQLEGIAYKHHTYSAYAKALIFLFTEELIITPLPQFNPQIVRRSVNSKPNQFKRIKVFPNPANDFLEIRNVHVPSARVSLHTLPGQLLISQDELIDGQTIDISSINSGVYLVSIHSANKLLHQEKLVIIK